MSKRDYDVLNLENRISTDKELYFPSPEASVDGKKEEAPVSEEKTGEAPTKPEAVEAKNEAAEIKDEAMEEDPLTGNKRKFEELGVEEEPVVAAVAETPKRFTSRIKHISKITNNLASRPSAEAKGHTSYLLFARKSVPIVKETQVTAQAEEKK